MASEALLKRLAEEILGLEEGYDENEISKKSRNLKGDLHPDVNDAENAEEQFKAVTTAEDFFNGDIRLNIPNQRQRAADAMAFGLPEGRLSEIKREISRRSSSSRSVDRGTGPDFHSVDDFIGATGAKRKQMIQELSIAIEGLLIYGAVQDLYKEGYGQIDFFDDVKEHIEDNDITNIDRDVYWIATRSNTRTFATKEEFNRSVGDVQERLFDEHGPNAQMRDVANIMANLIASGMMDLGDVENMAWESIFDGEGGVFGGDSVFTGRSGSGRGGGLFDSGSRRSGRRGSDLFDR